MVNFESCQLKLHYKLLKIIQKYILNSTPQSRCEITRVEVVILKCRKNKYSRF
jgi:hypothetical protein